MRTTGVTLLTTIFLGIGVAQAQGAASHVGAWKVEKFGAGYPYSWAYMVFNADGSACTGAQMNIPGADKPSTTGGQSERSGDTVTLRTSGDPMVFKWVSKNPDKAELRYPKGDLYAGLVRSTDIKTCAALHAKGKVR